MRARGCVAAAVGGIALLSAQAAAATVALTFRIDVTGSTADGFAPFSFLQTWTLSQDHSATVTDVPIIDTMKALESPTTSYVATFGDGVGVTRQPHTEFLLDEHGVGGFPEFDLALDNRHLNPLIPPPAFGPDLIPYLAGAGPFTLALHGPIPGHPPVGETRDGDPGFVVVDYTGVANLIVPTAAPEPEAWALMILGFGLSGAAIRTQRRRVTSR